MVVYHYTNYSNGWVVEVLGELQDQCDSYLLLPAENLWSSGVRGFLYILALLYLFMGVAIVSDIFMFAIEVITSKRKTIIKWDEETHERVSKEVLVWNETVANLTLMALGSSAPEILLAVIETLQTLDKEADDGGLGTFTIIGSAAFNLLIITAVCVYSVPLPDIKKVRGLGVFALTSCWSIFAYIWMLIVLQWISPGEIEPWEAWLTLAFFPIMVLTAYCQDLNWWCLTRKRAVEAFTSHTNVRVLEDIPPGHGVMHGTPRELIALEQEKRAGSRGTPVGSVSNMMSTMRGSQSLIRQDSEEHFIHSRFRHAAIRSLLGGKRKVIEPKHHMVDVVSIATQNKAITPPREEMFGKFTFSAPSYSILESAGVLQIDVIFHRRRTSSPEGNSGNGDSVKNGNAQTLPRDPEDTSMGDTGTGDMLRGTVSVEFETKEGSARFDKDLKFCKGLLEFKNTESIKTISIPIINDNQYEADVDFYVTLKNARGLDASVGDPNIARVTIIDDDEPGEFQFDQSSYYADPRAGSVALTVIREKGCDGNVSVEYSTIDGSAKGGPGLDSGVDYEEVHGVLQFQHCEAKKQVILKMNKDSLGSKNLLVTLRNPSIGAKIGKNSAVMVTITSDPLAERLANVMGDEEEITWSGQFKSAMVLEPEQDEDGNDLPLSGLDYVLHFISFFWKVIFAFIPPRTYLGAWPTFITSLLGIGMLTGLVEQLAKLLSCVIGLKASVAGITIVALGTSLPDTFASRTAALHDQYADASIGNITGSNSVNVFLGLGLPWVIKAMYKLAKNKTYTVSTNNLAQSVLVFVIVGTICLIILVLRRRFVGGELGGKNKFVKVLTASFMIFLWVIYIALSSIKAYNPDVLPW